MKPSPSSKTTSAANAAHDPQTLKDKIFRMLGPGLITGASDDDPSGIATYSQAGAQFGFSITWTLLFTYPLMAPIPEISGRIGRITGQGIAANLHQHYTNWLLQSIVALVLIANTINIGADLGAMGDAATLLRFPASLRPVFAIQVVFQTFPGFPPMRNRAHHGSDAVKTHAAQNEGGHRPAGSTGSGKLSSGAADESLRH